MSSQPPFRLPIRQPDAHKGDFGRVWLVGGSRGMAGSIALSAAAALRTGSGLVSAAVPDRCLDTVASYNPCVMTVPLADDGEGRFSLDAAAELVPRLTGSNAVGCGPGMTTDPGSIRIVERLLHETDLPRVFDADAINALATMDWNSAENHGPMVLTPHPGELERITGAAPGDRDGQIAAAGTLAQKSGAVIVVKGGPTVVVNGEDVWTNDTGNPGMATAGSGDVLTGVITSMLGQKLPPWQAACLGVWVHGRSGDLASEVSGQAGMTAADLLDALPRAVQDAVEPSRL